MAHIGTLSGSGIKLIAEPDISHGGSWDEMYRQIIFARDCGCNFYKLQMYDPERMGAGWKHKAPFYNKRKVEDYHIEHALDTCAESGIELMVTCNSRYQFERAKKLGISNVKIASGQACKEMMSAAYQLPFNRMFISTGMEDVARILDDIADCLTDNIDETILMHAVSLYPPEPSECNISRIGIINHNGWITAGYSDHTDSNISAVLAMGYGARYFERHFHMDNQWSPVGNSSSNENDFAEWCRVLRFGAMCMGSGSPECQMRENAVRDYYKDRWML